MDFFPDRAWRHLLVYCGKCATIAHFFLRVVRKGRCQSPQITLADTVGAGDASLAGYVASALRHGTQNWPQHLAWAVATGGAVSCTQKGVNLPQLHEIEALRNGLTIHKTE